MNLNRLWTFLVVELFLRCRQDGTKRDSDSQDGHRHNMNFQPLLESAQPTTVHAMAAMLAVGLGGVQFVLPKGSRLHRWLGYAWVVLMASVATTGLLIHEIRMVGPFSPIDLLSFFGLITFLGRQSGKAGACQPPPQGNDNALCLWAFACRSLYLFTGSYDVCHVDRITIWSCRTIAFVAIDRRTRISTVICRQSRSTAIVGWG